MKRLLAIFASLVWSTWSGWAAPSLTLLPAANISGSPGTTIGWGFEIDNDTANWLVVSSVTPSGFNPAVGTFSAYIAPLQFYVVNPNSIRSVAFAQATSDGFGEFAIAPGASGSASGTFDILYDLYANDPSINPLDVTPGNRFSLLTASVTVEDTSVPEPSTWLLSGLGLALAGRLKQARLQHPLDLFPMERRSNIV